MGYYIGRRIPLAFDAALEHAVGALKTEGFGVLTDVDVQATIKSKIGATMARYRILGACNPQVAHQALQLEPNLGVLLPCNVVVREVAANETEVAMIDPVASMERTGNDALLAHAQDVRVRLERVLAAI